MDHSAVRTAVLPSVMELIAQEYGISEDAAMEAFYRSATGAAFADDETGLYGQSPSFIFGLFREERGSVNSLMPAPVDDVLL